MNKNELKKAAALKAVDFIETGMIVGLGTGSTTTFAIKEIALRIKDGRLKNIRGIPSSSISEKLARDLNIPLITFDEETEIDITIDGADEVDSKLNLIKGGGAALLREKVLAQASKRNIIIVDASKLSHTLGTNWFLPIEVIPFAANLEMEFLKKLGGFATVRKHDDGRVLNTDQNNFIVDCNFGKIDDPVFLSTLLNSRAGIVEHGLFIDLTTDLIAADEEGITHFEKNKLHADNHDFIKLIQN